MARITRNLPVGTTLDAYVVEKILGGGGFGIVYLAREPKTRQRVVIKEYMPQKLAQRLPNHEVAPLDDQSREVFNQGRKLFINEAAALAKLKHPNIVDVVNFFQANGTVYMTMIYESGTNLQQYIKEHGGNLSEVFIRTVFPQLLEGLRAMHELGLLHLDIKPGNVHLRPGGRPLLLDFGAVHTMNLTRRHQTRQVVTPGFSPIEQYDFGGYVGPWTDIYALGATMRSCIEGGAPPAAVDRRDKDPMRPAREAYKKRYSALLLEAIDWAMEVDPLLRPQSVDDLLTRLAVEADAPIDLPQEDKLLDKLVNNLPWKRS